MQGGGRALLTEDEIQEGVHQMNQKADYDRSGNYMYMHVYVDCIHYLHTCTCTLLVRNCLHINKQFANLWWNLNTSWAYEGILFPGMVEFSLTGQHHLS